MFWLGCQPLIFWSLGYEP